MSDFKFGVYLSSQLKKIKLNKPSIGFYLLAGSLVLSIVAFVYYSLTYSAFGYSQNRWVIAMTVISFWSFLCLLGYSLFGDGKAIWMDIFYLIIAFGLTISTVLFLTPCLSPIGIYFTVGNMGDVEANAIGVPRCITGVVFYVLAILSVIAAAFFRRTAKRKEVQSDEEA